MMVSGSLWVVVTTVVVVFSFCGGGDRCPLGRPLDAPLQEICDHITAGVGRGRRHTVVCLRDGDGGGPASSLTLFMNHTKFRYRREDETTVVWPTTTSLEPPGKIKFCEEVMVPSTSVYRGKLYVTGRVAGLNINHTASVRLGRDITNTIIQTDKYLYQPGQKVQMRMISFTSGAHFNINTEQYSQVKVTAIVVALWKNVDNSAGLIHLDVILADEPEQISGCREVEVYAEDIKMIGCSVNSVGAQAIVTEEGTGVQITSSSRVSVTRSAITFKEIYKDNYVKPNLPYSLKVRAELPDKSPAAGVLVELCAADLCSNLTIPEDGAITIIFSSDTRRVLMKALTTRAAMYVSSYSTIIERYFSPSNSSLLIHAPEGRLNCASGIAQDHLLPVLFSATNQTWATITVQVVSRKRIQYSSTKEYELTSAELPISVEHLLEPLPAPPQHSTTGVVYISITVPPTASPIAKVLVWYIREDWEVVSDTRELEVDKCLPNTVDLSWSKQRAQPKEKAILKLVSAPNSICSLDAAFSTLWHYKIKKRSGAQFDDDLYCIDQLGIGTEGIRTVHLFQPEN